MQVSISSSSERIQNDALEYVYACSCEDGSLSIIVPNLRTEMDEESWKRRHHLEDVEDVKRFYLVQLPALRDNRSDWKMGDETIEVEPNDLQ